MSFDLAQYRNSQRERDRIADLLSLLPSALDSVLEIGARDGFISKLLTRHFKQVTALDLEKPLIADPAVQCVKGDATGLEFPDASFDLVFCSEVLEHIPEPLLQNACGELTRVAKHYVLVGVPHRQDIRMGRTTCYSCGGKNPPWGHVNSFDETRLKKLFPDLMVEKISFVGTAEGGTNFLACQLMDLAGNPYGTYDQEETCIHCGAQLKNPPPRTFMQKVFTKLAVYATSLSRRFEKGHANWVHILFKKPHP
ncbi:class I SAM-dependent methyltransferase [Methylomagnum sp.]